LLWNSVAITSLTLSGDRVVMATSREVHELSLKVKGEGENTFLLGTVSRGSEVSFAFTSNLITNGNLLKVSLVLYDQEISESAYFSVDPWETEELRTRFQLLTCPSNSASSTSLQEYLLLEGGEVESLVSIDSLWEDKYEATY